MFVELAFAAVIFIALIIAAGILCVGVVFIRRFHFSYMLPLTVAVLIIVRLASCSASDSAYFYTFLRSVVPLSVCLSSVTFDEFACHLAGTVVGPVTHCVKMGVPDSPSKYPNPNASSRWKIVSM